MERWRSATAVVAAFVVLLVVLASPVLGERPSRSDPFSDLLGTSERSGGSLAAGFNADPAADTLGVDEFRFLAAATQTAAVTPTPTNTPTPLPPTPTPSPTPTPTLAPINPPASGAAPAWTGLAAPGVSAAAAIVVDEDSGAVLYEKDAHTRLAPASLTKIATAMVALQKGGDLERWVDIDIDSSTMIGSSLMGLYPGDRFKLNHLLYGLMLPSGNDAALAIGKAVSGSVSAFVDDMNALAASLGLHNTHFANPHGLDAESHYSSAYDLAMLSRHAMAMPGFWPYSSTKYITVWGSRQLLLKNLNPVLYLYPGGDGVKTGFTDDAGKTLVGSSTRNGHRVYIVLLNAPEREGDALLLFDWAFNAFRWQGQ